MPLSQTAEELIAEGRLYYGDPCYQAQWGSTFGECYDKTKFGHLALMVLDSYGITVSPDSDQGYQYGNHLCCCPLDLLNQDPFQCINMSLQTKLLDEELWECYADEFGNAKFVRVLEGTSESSVISPLPRVNYCVPTITPHDIANLVIVNSADSPPFRKCGDWITIIDGSEVDLLRTIHPPIFADPASAKGVRFSWGEVTGFGGQYVSETCEVGEFNRYGGIVYPDFDRKQVYKDGVNDIFELQSWESILFWLIDFSYDTKVGQNILRHYQINFQKQMEIPVPISFSPSSDYSELFPPICDIGSQGTGTNPQFTLNLLSDTSLLTKSCESVQSSLSAAADRKSIIAWAEYSIPSFFGYGHGTTRISFNDVSKWNSLSEDCIDNEISSIYEDTTAIVGNGCTLDSRDRTANIILGCTSINFGNQVDRRTFDISRELWTTIVDDPSYYENGHMEYAFRGIAPHAATFSSDWVPPKVWQNPYESYMMTYLTQRVGSSPGCTSTYTFDTAYTYPGYLFGDGDNLWTMEELWAKVRVSRPGISIVGHGRGVDSIMPYMNLRVKPVYLSDFPVATAAAGENWDEGCVDAFDGVRDNLYCTIEEDTATAMERLQEAQTGNTIQLTLNWLYPDFAQFGTDSKDAFNDCCSKCLTVAEMLWGYIQRYKDEPNKSMTYVCGPPATQADIPQLGHTLQTPYGNRIINSISYSYTDGSNFAVNLEVGPVSVSQATAGGLKKKDVKQENVKGRIISHEYGALFKVSIPGIGIIKAWNQDYHPWQAGDTVQVTIYNQPVAL